MKTQNISLSKAWRSLSSAQKKFLRAMQGKPTTLAALQKRLKISPIQFAMWIRSRKFRSALRGVEDLVRVRRNLSMELNAACASEKVGLLIFCRKGQIARQTCANTLSHAQKSDAGRVRAEGAARAQRIQRDAGRGLAEAPEKPMQALPPDLSPEEAERLFRIIEADAPSPNATSNETT
jgi:hypothetical protein